MISIEVSGRERADTPPRPDSDFLDLARTRFRLAADAEAETRREALEDLEFFAGDQWPAYIKAARERAHRPCLTFPLLRQMANQVINAQRQSRPAIQVNPVDNGADVKTSHIIQGLLRHVELSSDSEIAYDTAFEHAVISGLGYFRIVTDYLDPRSFDQDIRIERILDPFSVYYDPGCRKPDYSDAQWCFVVEDLTREQYRQRFPKSEIAGLSDFSSIGDNEREWFHEGGVRVAEYFYVEYEPRTLVMLTDGSSVFDDAIPEGAMIAMRDGEPVQREVQVPRVKWALINGREVLKRRVWPGSHIPIIPVLGPELIVNGRRKLSGIVRHSKDAQRDYNYQRTALVEAVGLAPKAPWMVAEGQIEGYESLYERANVENLAWLPYRVKELNGQLVPPPQRLTASVPIEPIVVAIRMANQDMMGTSGVHEATLGKRGPEQSGRAIDARKQQGEVANFNFTDSLNRSIRFAGRQLVELAPIIYNRPGRVLEIVGLDDTHDRVTIGEAYKDEQGIERIYDLNVGRYDVTISAGLQYPSKRREFVDSILQFAQAAPQIVPVVLDLVARHMDFPGAKEVADRLKKMLPPQLQEGDGGPELPPEWKAKFEAIMQQHEALTAQLNAAKDELSSRRDELESKEAIAALDAQTKLVIAQLKTEATENMELMRQEVAALTAEINRLREDERTQQEMEMRQREIDAAAQQQPTEPQQ